VVVKYVAMRTARAKVIKGKVVTRAKFPEGTKLLLVVDEQEPEVELDDEDVAAIRRARASIRAGRKIPMDRLLKLLPQP
jgi:predicted sugar kinase